MTSAAAPLKRSGHSSQPPVDTSNAASSPSRTYGRRAALPWLIDANALVSAAIQRGASCRIVESWMPGCPTT